MLGSGKETKFINMLNLIIKLTGYKRKIKRIPRPRDRQLIEIGDFFVSYNKIKKFLGWYPKTKLDEGLKKTIGFYKLRLKEYL